MEHVTQFVCYLGSHWRLCSCDFHGMLALALHGIVTTDLLRENLDTVSKAEPRSNVIAAQWSLSRKTFHFLANFYPDFPWSFHIVRLIRACALETLASHLFLGAWDWPSVVRKLILCLKAKAAAALFISCTLQAAAIHYPLSIISLRS